MMLLTFTTLVASNEGEFEGRFVIEKMIKDNSYISEKTDRFFTNGVWIFDTKTGSIQGCWFDSAINRYPIESTVICSDWTKRYEDYEH